MKDAIYIEQTTLLLHAFAEAVKTLGKINLHDDNIHAEYFFRDFLNKLYGWNLGDANDEKKNEPGIDLKDEERTLMVQVSSTASVQKVKDSFAKASKVKYKGYRFYFLFLVGSASELRGKKFTVPDEFVFDADTDILDIDSLIARMMSEPFETKRELYELAQDHLAVLTQPRKDPQALSNVVKVLAEEMQGGDVSVGSVPFVIPEKIRLNRLDGIKNSITEHAEYTEMLKRIYETSESLGKFVRLTIHSSLQKVYESNKDKMAPVELYHYISDIALGKVLQSANRPTDMTIESMEWCVDVIVADAFEACKIFEHPQNVKYDVSIG